MLLVPALAACSSLGGDVAQNTTGETSQTGSTSGGSGTASDPATGTATAIGSTSLWPSGTDSSGVVTTGGTIEVTITGTSGSSGTTAATETGGTTDASGTSAGTSGGGVGACEPALGDYGDCDAVLGVAFNGIECATISGCNCAPDCDKFFPDVASCALTCAEAGHCNPDRLEPAGILKEPVMMGTHCDEVDACLSEPFFKEILEQIFGMLTCEGMAFPCNEGNVCHGLWAGPLEGDAWTQTCAATLVPGVGTLLCVVFGP